jgi:glycosyltransferase involved in cell wall biosynthesis
MRLVLLIPSIGLGGAERVMTLLATGLLDRGHEVCLVTLAGTRSDFYSLDPRATRVALDLQEDTGTLVAAVHANFRRVRAIRRAVRQWAPHAVLSFMTSMNVLTIAACTGLKTRVVVSERVDPASYEPPRPWGSLRSRAYPHADAIVVQTATAAEWFRSHVRRYPRIEVIPNPVAPAEHAAAAIDPAARPFLLAAGRLVPQKGFDILIRAFAQVAARCAGVDLAIAGEGPQEQELRTLTQEMGLRDRVRFLGGVRDLPRFMASALGFVLSSRFEGFPNVVLEALAHGLPVVATDCPGGPREVLHGGRFGLLVPSEDAAVLAQAMMRVVEEPTLRQELHDAAPASLQDYRLPAVTASWERVLAPDHPSHR